MPSDVRRLAWILCIATALSGAAVSFVCGGFGNRDVAAGAGASAGPVRTVERPGQPSAPVAEDGPEEDAPRPERPPPPPEIRPGYDIVVPCVSGICEPASTTLLGALGRPPEPGWGTGPVPNPFGRRFLAGATGLWMRFTWDSTPKRGHCIGTIDNSCIPDHGIAGLADPNEPPESPGLSRGEGCGLPRAPLPHAP